MFLIRLQSNNNPVYRREFRFCVFVESSFLIQDCVCCAAAALAAAFAATVVECAALRLGTGTF